MNVRLTRLNRRKQRGAALVEAAVVIPTLLIFLGVITYTHRSYTAKMDKQQGTRAGSLFYASHACQVQPPASLTPQPVGTQASPNGDGIPGSAASKVAPQLGPSNSTAASTAVNRDGNLAILTPPSSTVTGTAVQQATVVGLKREVYASSEVACNEEVFASKWTAVFGEIGSLYNSRFGL